jgi:hypothetical protein
MINLSAQNLARLQQMMDEMRLYNEFAAGQGHVFYCGTFTSIIKHDTNALRSHKSEVVEGAASDSEPSGRSDASDEIPKPVPSEEVLKNERMVRYLVQVVSCANTGKARGRPR